MPGTINPQDACALVNAALLSGMAAKLAALETEYGDGIDLPVPDRYWEGPQTKYPNNINIVSVAGPTTPTNSPDRRQVHHNFLEVIVAGAQSDDTYTATELLTKRLWRLVRAIQEILNNTTLTNQVDRVWVVSAEPSEFTPEGAGFEQRVTIDLQIEVTPP